VVVQDADPGPMVWAGSGRSRRGHTTSTMGEAIGENDVTIGWANGGMISTRLGLIVVGSKSLIELKCEAIGEAMRASADS
jgi:hypothetical protein